MTGFCDLVCRPVFTSYNNAITEVSSFLTPQGVGVSARPQLGTETDAVSRKDDGQSTDVQ
jgi:hypothetical protein